MLTYRYAGRAFWLIAVYCNVALKAGICVRKELLVEWAGYKPTVYIAGTSPRRQKPSEWRVALTMCIISGLFVLTGIGAGAMISKLRPEPLTREPYPVITA